MPLNPLRAGVINALPGYLRTVSQLREENANVAQPHRIRWDIVDGRPVRSLEAGRADSISDPVVFVPGLGALGYLLDAFHGCSARSGAFLLDVPGFGHRSPRPCSPTLPDLVRVVTGWLRWVCDRPVVLCGHSTGAQVALRAAVAAPERVSALVLAGPTFPPALRTWPALAGALLRDLPHEQLGQLPATLPYYRRAGRGPALYPFGAAGRAGGGDRFGHLSGDGAARAVRRFLSTAVGGQAGGDRARRRAGHDAGRAQLPLPAWRTDGRADRRSRGARRASGLTGTRARRLHLPRGSSVSPCSSCRVAPASCSTGEAFCRWNGVWSISSRIRSAMWG
jgi:pimeloyl-ACP methyl ester carboxylesterase